MGMSVGNSGVSGGRRRRNKRYAPMSEINVTPFVDVMLVLLIIFMVAAPLLTVGVPIDLPETQANELPVENQPLIIGVTENGEIFIGETPIELEELVPKLKAIAKNGLEERVQVRGARGAQFDIISKVMGRLNRAGFNQLGLISEPGDS